MSFTFRPARRENLPLLIGVAGGTGSGKTMSALRLARGLAGDKPFALIDTESGRAKHYADQFQPWEHGDLGPPFRPERYGDAIQAADEKGYPVIVVDSASHEWAGDGGLLDWHEEEFERLGGRDAVKMTAWIKPKMEHKKLVSRLLQVRAHVILCFRAEQKIEMVKDSQGKWQVVPKASLTGLDGWIPITEKSLPFELTLSFLLTADAPGLPKPIKLQEQHRALVPLDEPISEQTGARLAAWALGAGEVAPRSESSATPDEQPNGSTFTPPASAVAARMTMADFKAAREAAGISAQQATAKASALFPGRTFADLTDEDWGHLWAELQLEREGAAA